MDQVDKKTIGLSVKQAASELGAPTRTDIDVLLAFTSLTHAQGFTDPVRSVTREELAKGLGLDATGTSYRRIDESLNRCARAALHHNKFF